MHLRDEWDDIKEVGRDIKKKVKQEYLEQKDRFKMSWKDLVDDIEYLERQEISDKNWSQYR